MARCVIVSAYCPFGIAGFFKPAPDDFVICADGGYAIARKGNILPDVVIGDFDSYHGKTIEAPEIIRVPVQKDDTDTMLCLKYGMEKGYDDFVILGGIGGRLDHTLANLQILSYALDHSKSACLIDRDNMVYMIEGRKMEIPKREGYKLSLIAFSEKCTGVTAEGVEYELHDAVLDQSGPLGVSNEFRDETAAVGDFKGKLLVMLCRDEPPQRS